jgi:hypothetical protein
MTRNPKVWLHDAETRCVARACALAETCARALAPIPTRYATVADYSIDTFGWRTCPHWLDAQTARAPSAAPVMPRRHGPLTP